MSVRCEDQCYLGGGGRGPVQFGVGERREGCSPARTTSPGLCSREIPGVVRQPEGVFICMPHIYANRPYSDLLQTRCLHIS